jgi:hypothetical protein
LPLRENTREIAENKSFQELKYNKEISEGDYEYLEKFHHKLTLKNVKFH